MLNNNNILLAHAEQQKTFFVYPPALGFTFSIWREGDYPDGTYHTNYDWDALQNSIPTTNAYYVDPISGNDGNAGTIGSPLKSVKVAVEKSNRDIVYLKPGLYPYTEGLQGSNLSGVARPLRIQTYGGAGRAIISTATTLTFTPNATFPTTVQQASTAGDASFSVVDLTNTETVNGETRGIRLTVVSSIALCDSTVNSMYYNSVGNLLYVHTFDNRTVDANIITLRGQINAVNTGIQNVYMENVEFWGNSGAGVFSFNNNSTTQAYMTAVNCWFAYSSVIDGLDVRGTVEVTLRNCVAYANHEDGFNYTFSTSSYSPKCFEYYCTGWRNGYAISGADNNTTAHGSSTVIRVAGNYQYGANRSVHDIDTTIGYHVGCVSGNSTATNKISFACGGAGDPTNGCTAYYIECSSVGAQSAEYAVYQNTIVHAGVPLARGTLIRESGSKLRQVITPSISAYSDEYQAYLDELTFGGLAFPSSTEEAKDNTLITGLIADGEWDKIGILKRFKQAPSIGASLISLKYPALYKATAVNSPTFDADGVGSNGTSSYINTNWDISLDEMFLRDNCSMGVWVSVGASLSGSTRYLMGVNTTIAIGEASGVTNVHGRLNDGTNNEFTGNANFASGSSYIIRRTSSTNLELYVNGVLVNTVSTASTAAPPSGMLGVLCRIASGSPSLYSLSTWRIGAVFTGTGGIDPLEVHNRLATRFA